MPVQNNTAIRSEALRDFIGSRPSFLVRWGIVFFAAILLLLAGIAWFIHFPDKVSSKAILKAVNSPKTAIAHTDGRLIKLLVKENEQVMAGQPLCHMESLGLPAAIQHVKVDVSNILTLIENKNYNAIASYFPQYTSQSFLAQLGELQGSYQTFIQSFTSFRDFVSNGHYLRKRVMLEKDITTIGKLKKVLKQQQFLVKQDVQLSEQTFEANQTLAQQKVIAPIEYRNEESKFISKKMSIPQLEASIISNENQQNEKQKEIAELDNQTAVQKNSFVQALLTFKSQIEAWEYKYVVKSPIDGQLTRAGFLQENQEVRTGQPLFYINPGNTQYYMELQVPQYNFGKVHVGQRVLLKFQAYPFEQYGSVEGRLEFISVNPSDSGYLAKVNLTKGLTSTNNKPLTYINGLQAQAEIITEDLNLLQRFYYSMAKAFKSE